MLRAYGEGGIETIHESESMAGVSAGARSKKMRSASVRRARHPLSEADLDGIRPRTSSLPTRNTYKKPQLLCPALSAEASPPDYYRLRSFVTSSKGLINRGDSFKSRSSNSVVSSGSSATDIHLPASNHELSQGSASSVASLGPYRVFKVLVVGDPGVGKSALIQQFTTSEYMGASEAQPESLAAQSVSVLLDGEESLVDFVELPGTEEFELGLEIDAYVMVYAINDRCSFDRVVDVLFQIRKEEQQDCAIMLAANKSDLVRTRIITVEEAKSVASTYNCKYVETSTVVNHNVDELLAGLLSQIRIRHRFSKSKDGHRKGPMRSHSPISPKALFNKLFKKDKLSKSCENLYDQ